MDDQQVRPNDPPASVPAHDPAGAYAPAETQPRQSGIGIASFVLSLVCILGLVIATVMFASSIQHYISLDGTVLSPEEIEERAMNDGALIGGVLLFLGALGIGFVGLILGIIALALKGRRKVFAIIGTVLNGLVIAGLAALVIIGLAMQGTVPA